jgi:hypothetical protein
MIQKLKCVIVDDVAVSMEKLMGYCLVMPAKWFWKLFGFLIVFMAIGGNVQAQNPILLYHTIATDTTSIVLMNHTVSIRISIIQGSALNPIIYSESFTVTSDSMGVVSFTFGTGRVVSGSLSNVNWTASNLAMLEIDPNAGSKFFRIGLAPVNTATYMLIPNQP